MNAIVCVDGNWGIGYKGELLVKIRSDMEYFRQTTMGKIVVYGRETLYTFPNKSPLGGRTNIVFSRDSSLLIHDGIVVSSLDDFSSIVNAKGYNTDDIFIIGGQSIYELFLPYVKTAYVTKIQGLYQADRYFPDLDGNLNWSERAIQNCHTEDGVTFCFKKYENRHPLKCL